MTFDESSASPDELYKWCMEEYESNNFISRYLIDSFYRSLGQKIILPISNNISTILEIGCGPAISSEKIFSFVKRFCDFESSEFDDRYLSIIKLKKLPFPISKLNAEEISKPDRSYDCVIMLEVLEHLENYGKAVRELFRVSKRYVIISVPCEPLWRMMNLMRFKYVKNLGNTPGHVNHWGPRGLRKLIDKFGKIRFVKIQIPWLIVLAERR